MSSPRLRRARPCWQGVFGEGCPSGWDQRGHLGLPSSSWMPGCLSAVAEPQNCSWIVLLESLGIGSGSTNLAAGGLRALLPRWQRCTPKGFSRGASAHPGLRLP